MQTIQGFNPLPPVREPLIFRLPVRPQASTGQPALDGSNLPVGHEPPAASFEKLLLRNFGGPIPLSTSPDAKLSPLGEPPHADKLGTQVRDYRETLDAVRSDLVAQLKLADQALKQARQSGNQDAVAAAQSAIDTLKTQIQANCNSLSVVHNDVKALRELRQQLSADVAAGNVQAAQQDRNAIEQQRFQLVTDLQA